MKPQLRTSAKRGRCLSSPEIIVGRRGDLSVYGNACDGMKIKAPIANSRLIQLRKGLLNLLVLNEAAMVANARDGDIVEIKGKTYTKDDLVAMAKRLLQSRHETFVGVNDSTQERDVIIGYISLLLKMGYDVDYFYTFNVLSNDYYEVAIKKIVTPDGLVIDTSVLKQLSNTSVIKSLCL